MSFQERLDLRARLVGDAIVEAMSDAFPLSDAWQAAHYAMAGGKRLRAFLVAESADLFGASAFSTGPAIAIEAIHASSLIHDDLPCMDDDDLRRGKPTVHRKWDEATAVLAGDALQAFAFEQLAQCRAPADRVVELTRTLARAAGAAGMVYGQSLDIAAETAGEPLSLEDITELQRGKTGALIEWAAMAGPRLAGEDPSSLKFYAQALGLAYQIADDILDVEGDEEKTGKRVRKDEGAGKATFVSLLGLEGAKARARELVAEALHNLAPYGAEADALRDAARFAISREF